MPYVDVDYSVPVIPKKLRFQWSADTRTTRNHKVGYFDTSLGTFTLSFFSLSGTPTQNVVYDITLPFTTAYSRWLYGFNANSQNNPAIENEYALIVQCQPGSYTEVPVDPYYCLKCPNGTYSTSDQMRLPIS